jgi:hypothetical protein
MMEYFCDKTEKQTLSYQEFHINVRLIDIIVQDESASAKKA